MIKNTASQKWIVFAFDATDNLPKTGDAINITGNLRLDGAGANAIDDYNPTELESGYYIFDITQAESNADLIVMCSTSSTTDIEVIGVPGAVWTEPIGRKYAATLASTDVTGNINANIKATEDIAFSPTQSSSLATGYFSDGQKASVATAVWDSLKASHTDADSYGAYLDQKVSEVAGSSLTTTSLREVIGLAESNLDDQLGSLATISEFEARTIPTADYFDPAVDAVAEVVHVGTVATTSDMRGTDDAATAVVCTEARLAELDAANIPTDLNTIKTDTDELQTDWKNTGRLDTILDAVKAKTDTIGGAGTVTWVYTLTDDDTSDPIENADVWVSTDIGGTNVIAVGTTDAAGEVTFYLDPGTRYIWRSASGYTFVNPDTEVIA